ncbi:MAG: hypothetical protein ABJC13_14345 [Acidobacteriota bacterium]
MSPINPALPWLALAALLPLIWPRRQPAVSAETPDETGLRSRFGELGLPWAVAGCMGIALLAPALSIPDGIPSPAADLAAVAPWAGSEAGLAGLSGNPVLRDVTFQIQPWLVFLKRELAAGRWPGWNPYSFAGAPFGANGQSAPLFPLHLLFALLPLQIGFVVLPWLRIVLAGCGAWLFAREIGLSRPAALWATIGFPLSGMLVSFLLFPMGNALALVPWVLWAVERLAAGRSGGALLALGAGFQLLGGHPETSMHTALLAGLYLLVRGSAGRTLSTWGRFVAAWALAAGIAAVQILPLALLLPATAKWGSAATASGPSPPFGLLLLQPLRLVLPQLYGHPALGTWWGPFNYSATAVYAGALGLPFAAAGLGGWRTDRRVLGLAAIVAFCFLGAYHLPGVHDLLAALPLLGRAAHHRLIFGLELGLPLLGAVGIDRWLAGKGRGLLAGGAVAAAMLAAAWIALGGPLREHDLAAGQLAWTLVVLGLALAAALSLKLSIEGRWRVVLCLPALLVIDLLIAHGRIVPGLPFSRFYPETGAVRFLKGQSGRVAALGEQLRPNAGMVYGLRDLRGDDPVKLASFEAAYGALGASDPVYLRPIERWGDPRLDRWGLRWVLGGPAEAAPVSGWRLAYAGGDARVWERPTALPRVRWAGSGGAAGDLTVEEAEPGLWRIAVPADGARHPPPRRLVVAETWARGWRGVLRTERAERELAVEPADAGTALAIDLPEGERERWEIDLTYRPPGLAAGALLTPLSLLAAFALRRRERGERPA